MSRGNCHLYFFREMHYFNCGGQDKTNSNLKPDRFRKIVEHSLASLWHLENRSVKSSKVVCWCEQWRELADIVFAEFQVDNSFLMNTYKENKQARAKSRCTGRARAREGIYRPWDLCWRPLTVSHHGEGHLERCPLRCSMSSPPLPQTLGSEQCAVSAPRSPVQQSV